MLTEESIIFNKAIHNKEDYTVMAFVIDGEVVDVFAISKTFLNLYTNNTVVEHSLQNGRYRINLKQDEDVVENIIVSQKIGAILLSDPVMVELSLEKDNYRVVPGMRYVDGISWTR